MWEFVVRDSCLWESLGWVILCCFEGQWVVGDFDSVLLRVVGGLSWWLVQCALHLRTFWRGVFIIRDCVDDLLVATVRFFLSFI